MEMLTVFLPEYSLVLYLGTQTIQGDNSKLLYTHLSERLFSFETRQARFWCSIAAIAYPHRSVTFGLMIIRMLSMELYTMYWKLPEEFLRDLFSRMSSNRAQMLPVWGNQSSSKHLVLHLLCFEDAGWGVFCSLESEWDWNSKIRFCLDTKTGWHNFLLWIVFLDGFVFLVSLGAFAMTRTFHWKKLTIFIMGSFRRWGVGFGHHLPSWILMSEDWGLQWWCSGIRGRGRFGLVSLHGQSSDEESRFEELTHEQRATPVYWTHLTTSCFRYRTRSNFNFSNLLANPWNFIR